MLGDGSWRDAGTALAGVITTAGAVVDCVTVSAGIPVDGVTAVYVFEENLSLIEDWGEEEFLPKLEASVSEEKKEEICF